MPRDDFLDGLLDAPLLTKGEEQCLAVAIRDGRNAAAELAAGSTDPLLASLVDEGRRAHRTFIESNLRLVASVVKRRPPVAGVSAEDLFQEGVVGLHRAVELFDPDKGFKFSTYATNWIKQAIGRFTERNRSSLSGNATLLGEAVAAVRRGDPLSDKQQLALSASKSVSGDAPRLSDDDGFSLFDMLGGESDTEVEAMAAVAHVKRVTSVRASLDSLSATTRMVIEKRYGVGCEPMSTVAIARDLGVSSESVRRRINRGLDRLRKPLADVAA